MQSLLLALERFDYYIEFITNIAQFLNTSIFQSAAGGGRLCCNIRLWLRGDEGNTAKDQNEGEQEVLTLREIPP